MSDTTTAKKHLTLKALFATDRTAEEQGKWFEIGPEIKFKLRRFKSEHSTKVREALEKPYEKLRVKGMIPADAMKEIVIKTMALSVIVDWEGVYGEDGNPVPFSADAAETFLKELPELADELASLAATMDNFREEDDQATLGN